VNETNEQNGLPELPKDWTQTTVGEIADLIHYGYTESATSENTGTKFLRITDIQSNNVDWDSVPFCKISEAEREKYLLNERDLLFARTGATVGKSFLIRGVIPKSIFASYLIRIILNREVNERFIYNFFQSSN
jgi:type I restriction enzyme S subunit